MENIEDQISPEKPRKSLETIPSQKFLMGVCSAFGNYIGFNPVIIRMIVLLAFLILGQPIILIYAAFGILLPVGEENELEKNNLANSITLNIIFILVIILFFLMQSDYLTLKEIFQFLAQRTDAFSLLVFSIALLINGYHKESLDMKEPIYKRLTLSDNKIIFGVCGGLAEYLNIPPNLMRIIWIIFGISSFGIAILIYIILRFIIPPKNIYSDNDG